MLTNEEDCWKGTPKEAGFFSVKSACKVVGSLVEVGDSWGSMKKSVFHYLCKIPAPSKAMAFSCNFYWIGFRQSKILL